MSLLDSLYRRALLDCLVLRDRQVGKQNLLAQKIAWDSLLYMSV